MDLHPHSYPTNFWCAEGKHLMTKCFVTHALCDVKQIAFLRVTTVILGHWKLTRHYGKTHIDFLVTTCWGRREMDDQCIAQC